MTRLISTVAVVLVCVAALGALTGCAATSEGAPGQATTGTQASPQATPSGVAGQDADGSGDPFAGTWSRARDYLSIEKDGDRYLVYTNVQPDAFYPDPGREDILVTADRAQEVLLWRKDGAERLTLIQRYAAGVYKEPIISTWKR